MLRIAIVGCGKIADQHVQAIHRIPDCEIVALCDRESLMAKQLGDRCGAAVCFSDAREMLHVVSPDVVHITTPPQSHYSLAAECLKAGSHVYVEKPFTVTAGEAESLIQLAEDRGLKATVGHNGQFTLEMLELRRLVKKGFLGGKPVHLESYFYYDLTDARSVGSFLGNRDHWVHQLPGQLFHNVVSHGIAKLAEFLDDDISQIVAIADQSPRLRHLGGEEILDELRVVIRDNMGTTAFFCFSTQTKRVHQLHIYGPDSSVVVDHASGNLIRNRYRSYKSYLTYFIPPVQTAREHLRSACINVANFLRQRLYQDFGMKELIERFYNSIRLGDPLPIPYREILLTARIMDEIFAQVYPERNQSSIPTCVTAKGRPPQSSLARRSFNVGI
jgi:predicted dehydrogenase